MFCRIARAYGGWPWEVAAWPFSYYRKVRNELVRSWKPIKPRDPDTIEM
jgi:hypothetical protein